MKTEQKRRRGSQWMIVAIAMLAFAVFSWGVQYKLSLYNPTAHMSSAKLLSQRERPATFETTKLAAVPLVSPEPSTLFALAMGVTIAALCFLKPVFLLRVTWHQALLPQQPDQTFFFFRPPPFLLA